MSGDIPISRLEFFRRELGLDETKLSAIRPYADKLAGRSRKAARYLEGLVRKVVPRARLELTLEFFGGALRHFWIDWYARLWTRPWDEDFLRDLWQQGVEAARMGIDLQYVMLGDVKCRQLFLRAVRKDVPLDQRGAVSLAVNDLLDLCLLVRAKGHAAYHAEAAEPLLQGLFHQTRNPLTVIGGTAMRLMRTGGPDVRGMAQVILEEALRLERMTRNISTYNAVTMAEPAFKAVAIGPVLEQAVRGLRAGPAWPPGVETHIALDQRHPEIDCDPDLLGLMLQEVLVNALEAMPAGEGVLSITTGVDKATPNHLSVSILGSGELPRGQDVAQLFLPFTSSKPRGTGFGLAIALAAARKCFGKVTLAQTEAGVVCTLKLPLQGQIDETGLLAQQEF